MPITTTQPRIQALAEAAYADPPVAANLLLERFGSLAETPASAARVRSLVINLAVRGKLDTQNIEDEISTDLLTRIRAEKLKRTDKEMVTDEAPAKAPFPLP